MQWPAASRLVGEAELVRAARRGERAAFDRLARHYRGVLLAAAFARTRDREAAEDLVQEVLARSWQGLPGLREAEAFAGWLRTSMLHACLNWERRRPRTEPLDAVAEGRLASGPRWDPVEQVLARERSARWREAVQSLPEANRVALAMHVLGGYSAEEIAALQGVSVSTIYSRLHRARRQLARLVEVEEAGPLSGPRYLREEPEP